MFDLGITKPKRIVNNLLLKLESFLRTLKNEKFGKSNINLIDLKSWLEDNLIIPIDKTKPFVVHFELSMDEKNPSFRFFVSTKLLSASAVSSIVHMDGTYKLIWQGYPILHVGTTDMHRSFHPFGLGVCTNEQTADYQFIFESMKKGVKNVYNIYYP